MLTTASPFQDCAVGVTGKRAGTSWRPRLAPATCLVLLVAGTAAAPAVGLLATFGSLRHLLRGRWRELSPALVMVVLLVTGTVVALAAARSGSGLEEARVCVFLAQLTIGVLAVLQPQGSPSPAGDVTVARIALTPAALAVGVGILQSLSPSRSASWSLVGTDIAEHVLLLGSVQEAGGLEYESTPYPRGLHALLAVTSGPWPAEARSTELMAADLSAYAATTWFAFGLLLYVAAVTTTSEAVRRQLSPRATTLAACIPPWSLLGSGQAQEAFIYLGAAPAMLGIVALWLLVTVQGSARPWTDQLVLSAAVFVVVSHLWQPLALAPVVVGLGLLRRGLSGRTATAKPRATVTVCASLLATVVAVPALLAVSTAQAVDIAGYYGVLPAPPLTLLLLGMTGLVVCLLRRTVVEAVTAAALIAVVVALLMAANGGMDLAQYYPRKAVWILLVFCLPFAGSAVVEALRWGVDRYESSLRDRPDVRRWVRLAAPAAAGLLVLGVAGPGLLRPNSVLHQSVRGDEDIGLRRWQIATADYGGAGSSILAVGAGLTTQDGQPGSFILSKLFRFRTGQPRTVSTWWTLCQDVASLRTSGPALVLTDVRPQLLRRAANSQGCGLPTAVRLPGGYGPAVERLEAEILRATSAAAPS